MPGGPDSLAPASKDSKSVLDEVADKLRRLDKAGTGLLPKSIVAELIRGLLPKLPEHLVERLASGTPDAGTGGCGEVNYQEWLRWLFTTDNARSSAATLRVVQVTDVYTLEEFPSLRTLIQEKRKELREERGDGSRTVSVLTGDFLMPYLLSTVDRGHGMMQMLNETPIDYVTWGNHEDDLGHTDVMNCVRQYGGIWINSNMTSHESFGDPQCQCQRDSEVVEISSADGSNTRRVGLIAVLSNDPSLYKPGAFGGATIDDPWQTMAKYQQLLLREQHCDLVLPLCHLYEPQDERTARDFNFPVVLSGHDHHRVDRVVDGTRILKPGSDARYAVVLDITWESSTSTAPHIHAETLKVAEWPADAKLHELMKKSYEALDTLRLTQLTVVPKEFRPLTSEGARRRRVSCATFLCSAIRDSLNLHCVRNSPHCDCVLINGGNFRGERNYKEDQHITLEALRSELDDEVEIVVAMVPGDVLSGGLCETWQAPGGGWMQYDDGVEVDAQGVVVKIDGRPIVAKRRHMYRVGTSARFGIQLAPRIEAYFREDESRRPHLDTAIPVHALLMAIFAEQAWVAVWKRLDEDQDNKIDSKNIQKLDKNNSGGLDRREMMQGIRDLAGFSTFKDDFALVDVIMHIAGDDNGDGHLSIEEMNNRRDRRVRELYPLRKTLRASRDKARQLFGPQF